MYLSANQMKVHQEGIEHYRRLREFLEPLGVRNNIVTAYDLSATYNLEEELEVAPSQIGQFTTFGEFTEEHLKTLFDEIEKNLSNCPLLDCLVKRYYLQGIRNRLLEGESVPNPRCVALNAHLRLLPDGRVPTY